VRRGIREYWVHDSLSHVDFITFCHLDELRAFFPTLCHASRLAAFRNQFEGRPRIQNYLASGNRRPAVFGIGLDGPKVDPDARLKPEELFYNPWMLPIRLRE
jgi:hypothetical protein